MPEELIPAENKGVGLLLKVIGIVIFTTTLILSGFGWYRYQNTSKYLIRELRKTLELTSERLSIGLKTPLNDYADNEIVAVVASEMKSHLISGIFIMDKNKIQYGFIRNEKGEVTKTDKLLPEDGYFINNQNNITQGNLQLGQLIVYMTQRYLNEDLYKLFITTVMEVIVLDIILMVILTLFFRFVIVIPLNRFVNLITKVSRGDFSENHSSENSDTDLRRGDEMRMMTKSVMEMRSNIRKVMEEINHLISGIHRGVLDIRGNTDEFEGGWKEMLAGINKMFDAFSDPIRVTADYLDRLAKGDIPEKITKEYHGDFNKIIDNLNNLIRVTDEITKIAEDIAGGNMIVEVLERSENDRLMTALNSMIKGLQETVRVAEKIAEGDLRVQIEFASEKDILRNSLNKMLKDLIRVAVNVKKTAENVATGSEELSSSAAQISQGTSQQSAGIEEISTSIEEMSSTITQTAENAHQTAKIAAETAKNAMEGKKVLLETIQAMEIITQKNMIIEEIARQTAMLSLNAAIEAARAHEQGRGFAVVANEVGKLSKKTQQAAKQVNELSVTNKKIAENAGILMEKMVTGIGKTSDLIQEISAACTEQSGGIEQVNKAIQEFEQVIQENAALTQQMAASSINFSALSENLLKLVSFFNLPENLKEFEEEKKSDQELTDIIKKLFEEKSIKDISLFLQILEKVQEQMSAENKDTAPCNPLKQEDHPNTDSLVSESSINKVTHLANHLSDIKKAGKAIDMKIIDENDFKAY